MSITHNDGYRPNTSYAPTSVATPLFIEPVAALYPANTGHQLWIALCGADTAYGGAQVWMSTDGGASYNVIGSVMGNATRGVTVGDWPIEADPDTTNDLAVDLTESLGALVSYPTSDEDNFIYPCYVAGGAGSIPYELMSYGRQLLTTAYNYTLKATGGGGNHLPTS